MNEFKSIVDFMMYFKNEAICEDYLKSIMWREGVICPHCKHTGKMYFLSTRNIREMIL